MLILLSLLSFSVKMTVPPRATTHASTLVRFSSCLELYLIVTSQYSSNTLHQVSYHMQ